MRAHEGLREGERGRKIEGFTAILPDEVERKRLRSMSTATAADDRS